MRYKTLFDFLEDNFKRKDGMTIDFHLRAEPVWYLNAAAIKFYIHPQNKNGDTPTFLLTKVMDINSVYDNLNSNLEEFIVNSTKARLINDP